MRCTLLKKNNQNLRIGEEQLFLRLYFQTKFYYTTNPRAHKECLKFCCFTVFECAQVYGKIFQRLESPLTADPTNRKRKCAMHPLLPPSPSPLPLSPSQSHHLPDFQFSCQKPLQLNWTANWFKFIHQLRPPERPFYSKHQIFGGLNFAVQIT